MGSPCPDDTTVGTIVKPLSSPVKHQCQGRGRGKSWKGELFSNLECNSICLRRSYIGLSLFESDYIKFLHQVDWGLRFRTLNWFLGKWRNLFLFTWACVSKAHIQQIGYVPWRHLYYILLRNDVTKDVPVELYELPIIHTKPSTSRSPEGMWVAQINSSTLSNDDYRR